MIDLRYIWFRFLESLNRDLSRDLSNRGLLGGFRSSLKKRVTYSEKEKETRNDLDFLLLFLLGALGRLGLLVPSFEKIKIENLAQQLRAPLRFSVLNK